MGRTRVHLDRVEDLGDFLELRGRPLGGSRRSLASPRPTGSWPRSASRPTSSSRAPTWICWRGDRARGDERSSLSELPRAVPEVAHRLHPGRLSLSVLSRAADVFPRFHASGRMDRRPRALRLGGARRPGPGLRPAHDMAVPGVVTRLRPGPRPGHPERSWASSCCETTFTRSTASRNSLLRAVSASSRPASACSRSASWRSPAAPPKRRDL